MSIERLAPRPGDPKSNIGLFVDGDNMFYAQKYNGWHLDYFKLYQLLASVGNITTAHFFQGSPPYQQVERIRTHRKFCATLTRFGYTVKTKETKVFTDSVTGQVEYKSDLDIHIATAILTTAELYDICVLVGGDGDFAEMMAWLRHRGKRVVVIGRRQMVALELRNEANLFVDLNEYREQLEKLSK